MSVLIKIDMPKEKAIAIVIHPDGTAYTAKMTAGVCTEYLADCIAVEVPEADVRPVVLCWDCIYAPIGNQDGADLEWPCDDFPERNPCPLKCEDRWYSRKPAPDFFCANGVKRSRNEQNSM